MFTVLRYLKYLIFARHGKGHGIHSPFVYKLITDIFRHEPDKEIIKRIRNIRRKLLTDAGTVTVTDFGSGSRKDEIQHQKRVSEIARNTAGGKIRVGCLTCQRVWIATDSGIGNTTVNKLDIWLQLHQMYPCSTIEGCGALAEIGLSEYQGSRYKEYQDYERFFLMK